MPTALTPVKQFLLPQPSRQPPSPSAAATIDFDRSLFETAPSSPNPRYGHPLAPRAVPPPDTFVAAAAYSSATHYGNKTANLARLDKFLRQRGLQNQLQVPPFRALAHQTVRDHLQRLCGRQLLSLESTLRHLVPKGTRALSGQALTCLADLRHLIRSELVKSPLPLRLPVFAQHADVPIVVRSTGREDSEDFANAGGNQSVANVCAKDPAALARAIATVVASYYSDRSILQRLLAGDDAAAAPFTPVLLQVMVGEVAEEALPTSGVLFTVEPEGPTPVTQIQSTFGHNEAVVASLLPCDTFYVSQEGVRSVVRRKPARLVPSVDLASAALVRRDNPAEARMRPSLPDSVIRLLHRLGQSVAKEYGGTPMDIEWTYSPEKNLVYLFQARPLIAAAGGNPSHIDPRLLHDVPQKRVLMIGTAGGQTRLLEDQDGLLFANDLRQALQLYLKHPQQDRIQGVAVREMAAATSHEATTFRAACRPVMVVDDLEAARLFVAAHGPVALDASMGKLIAIQSLWRDRTDKVSLAGLREMGVLRPGWGKHPLPSLHSTEFAAGLQAEGLRHLLLGILTDVGHSVVEGTLAQLAQKVDLLGCRAFSGNNKQILTRLLDGIDLAPDRASRALAMAQLLRVCLRLGRTLGRHNELAACSHQLVRAVCRSLSALRACEAEGPRGIGYLYEMNWLRSTLLQQVAAGVICNASFESLLGEGRAAQNSLALSKRVETHTKDARAFMLVYLRMSKLALRPELAQAWQKFMQATLRDGDQANQRLAKILLQVNALDIAAIWLNTSFARAWKKSDSKGCLNHLEEAFADAQASRDIAWVRQSRHVAERWRGRLSEWADESRFNSLLSNFRNEFVQVMRDGSREYANAGKLGRQSMLSWLVDSVEIFHQTIKSLTGSPDYTVSKKVDRFFDLLVEYAEMVPLWLQQVPNLANQASGDTTVGTFARIQVHLLKAHQPRDAGQLVPGGLFNVAAAQLGSGAECTQHQATTLEDHFTLTHQNFLAIAAAAHADLDLGLGALPPRLENLCHKMVDGAITLPYGESSKVQLVSITYRHPAVAVDMNVRLREHSLKICLCSDQRLPNRATLHFDLFGKQEHNRADRVMLYAGLFGAAMGVPFAKGGRPSYDPTIKTAQWTWQLDLQSRNARNFADKIVAWMGVAANTTFAPEDLRQMLKRLRPIAPDLDATLRRLPIQFFCDMPWYNSAFIAQGRATPALLKAVMSCPPGQNRVFRDSLHVATAILLAQQIAEQGKFLENLHKGSTVDELGRLAAQILQHHPQPEVCCDLAMLTSTDLLRQGPLRRLKHGVLRMLQRQPSSRRRAG